MVLLFFILLTTTLPTKKTLPYFLFTSYFTSYPIYYHPTYYPTPILPPILPPILSLTLPPTLPPTLLPALPPTIPDLLSFSLCPIGCFCQCSVGLPGTKIDQKIKQILIRNFLLNRIKIFCNISLKCRNKNLEKSMKF